MQKVRRRVRAYLIDLQDVTALIRDAEYTPRTTYVVRIFRRALKLRDLGAVGDSGSPVGCVKRTTTGYGWCVSRTLQAPSAF